MGRHRLPANVHMLRGNPSKLPLNELLDSFQPEVDIPTAPRHLWPEARKEWRRITPQLERYGLISQLDRAALAMYCQSYARWVWAEDQLDRARERAAADMAAAQAKGEPYIGGDGVTVLTPSGHATYSPHWVIANKAMQQVKEFLAAFGLSPATRSAVRQSANRQGALFDEADDEGQAPEGFGAL